MNSMNKQAQAVDEVSGGISGTVKNPVGVRITGAFVRTVWFFADNAQQRYCGADVMRALRLPSGTVYPLLTRMVDSGWLTRELEEVDPKKVGRPAKRFYQLTPAGLKEARKLINRQFPGLGWSKAEPA
jgi:DNA-binding MarR family transcriptional regulator